MPSPQVLHPDAQQKAPLSRGLLPLSSNLLLLRAAAQGDSLLHQWRDEFTKAAADGVGAAVVVVAWVVVVVDSGGASVTGTVVSTWAPTVPPSAQAQTTPPAASTALNRFMFRSSVWCADALSGYSDASRPHKGLPLPPTAYAVAPLPGHCNIQGEP